MAKNSPPEREHLQQMLTGRAVALFGEERAQVLAGVIADTAEVLSQLTASPPEQEEEPDYWE